ncbi:MAG: signal recognition particle protein [Fimbriimonadales bacterium]
MFESLTQKLGGIFGRLRGRGRLTEKDVTDALREVRVALLEADVNYKVVKDFVQAVREKAVGERVWEALQPDEQVVKIVRDHLVELLGGEPVEINWNPNGTTVFLLCGLQGSGKTTTAAKMVRWLQGLGKTAMLAACDLQRPAAVKQLRVLGEQVGAPVFAPEGLADPVRVAKDALAACSDASNASGRGISALILDTAGRLQIDDDLMAEVAEVKRATAAHETLLVVDGSAGQESVNVAKAFHERLGLDGVILTKMDGDARGGAALSIRAVCGKPIRFVGTGEKTDALEPFYPDRAASRILGMGDVLSLIEKAEQAISQEQAMQMEAKLRTSQLSFEDLLQQLQMVKKLGPLEKLVDLVPGMSQVRGAKEALQGKTMSRVEAIILSMTPEERRNPEILNGSRKRRIAAGSGVRLEDVNALIMQLHDMRRMMKGVMGMRKRMKRLGKAHRS